MTAMTLTMTSVDMTAKNCNQLRSKRILPNIMYFQLFCYISLLDVRRIKVWNSQCDLHTIQGHY